LKWFYPNHIFKWYFGHTHHQMSSFMDVIWMKIYNETMMSSFLLLHHHVLVKCTINIWLQLFPHRIWSKILWLQSICNHLKHLIIDFLVAKDKILSCESYGWCSCNTSTFFFSKTSLYVWYYKGLSWFFTLRSCVGRTYISRVHLLFL